MDDPVIVFLFWQDILENEIVKLCTFLKIWRFSFDQVGDLDVP